jgi:hypothetical protein
MKADKIKTGNKKGCIAATIRIYFRIRLEFSGSPTWTRTKSLRINRTGHSRNYASKVEESEDIFFWAFCFLCISELCRTASVTNLPLKAEK